MCRRRCTGDLDDDDGRLRRHHVSPGWAGSSCSGDARATAGDAGGPTGIVRPNFNCSSFAQGLALIGADQPLDAPGMGRGAPPGPGAPLRPGQAIGASATRTAQPWAISAALRLESISMTSIVSMRSACSPSWPWSRGRGLRGNTTTLLGVCGRGPAPWSSRPRRSASPRSGAKAGRSCDRTSGSARAGARRPGARPRNGVVLKRVFIEGSEVKAGESLFLIDPLRRRPSSRRSRRDRRAQAT